MHSALQRLNALSTLLSSCVLTLLAAVALSSFVFTADPKGMLDVSVKVHPGMSRPQLKRDFAFVRFNTSVDFTPLFHWNTKQLFVYMGAEYIDEAGVTNDVVLWDWIITRKEDAVLKVNGRNKYKFKDLSTSFSKAKPATYYLRYNVMPYVGVLTYGEAARTTEPIPFPAPQERVA